jgi:hypothetical protein
MIWSSPRTDHGWEQAHHRSVGATGRRIALGVVPRVVLIVAIIALSGRVDDPSLTIGLGG